MLDAKVERVAPVLELVEVESVLVVEEEEAHGCRAKDSH